MKANFVLRISATLLMAALAQTTLPAQTWQTVDDFTYAPGGAAEPSSAAVDAAGGIYVAGYGNPNATNYASSYHAVLRYSGDRGATWETVDDFVYPGGLDTFFNAVCVAPGGAIFTAGTGQYVTNGSVIASTWFVRRSTDHGLTWQTVDDFSSTIDNGSSSIASDTNGNLYVLGNAVVDVFTGTYSLFVRASNDGGTIWQSRTSSTIGVGYQAICVGADLYAAVNLSSPSSSGSSTNDWQVDKSTDGGFTWAVVDNYSCGIGLGSTPHCLAADSAGNLYVAGEDVPDVASGTTYWNVREGQPDGTNWTQIGYFQGMGETYPKGVTTDSAGNVYVTGNEYSTSSTFVHWITRQLSVSTGQWSTIDEFDYNTNSGSDGQSVVSDAAGDILVAGFGVVPGNVTHWLVRELASSSSALPPPLQISLASNSLAISWPAWAANAVLEASTAIGPGANWTPLAVAPQVVNSQFVATLGLTNNAQFFRLSQ